MAGMESTYQRLSSFHGTKTKCSLLYLYPGTIPNLARDVVVPDKSRREVPVRSKLINAESDSVIAHVCLGVAVTGIYTLVGMGLIIVFM